MLTLPIRKTMDKTEQEIKKLNDVYALICETLERYEVSNIGAIYVLTRCLHDQNMIIDELIAEQDDTEN